MARIDETVRQGTRKYGERFDSTALAPQFVPHFNSGQRVRVRFSYGEEMTGRVSITTGWRPSFMLMRRSSDHGSSWLLGDNDRVVAVQHGRYYTDC